MVRDILKEINDVKNRNNYNTRIEYSTHLRKLEDLLNDYSKLNLEKKHEVLKYIPVSVIACLQAFFRSTIKDLIDFGSPYRQNVKNFNKIKNIKFDFEIVDAIHTKNLTIGDFVSHMLPYSNLEDLNSNISVVLGLDFLKDLKNFKKRSGKFQYLTNKYLENNDQIIADIKSLFELRNIICHEFTNNVKFNEIELLRQFENVKLFLEQTNDFIFEKLYPNAPQTQKEINALTEDELQKSQNRLDDLIVKILRRDKESMSNQLDNDKFMASIVKWKEFRESKAISDSHICEGGSMELMIYNTSKRLTTDEFCNNLEKSFKFLLDDNYVNI